MKSMVSTFMTCAMHFITNAFSRLSSMSESPLFSSLLTIHLLFYLYLPPFFLKLLLSPVALIALSLLVVLLRLGSPSRQVAQNKSYDPKTAGHPGTLVADSLVGWDVKAPLEVIFEDYEEGEEGGDVDEPALSLEDYYQETDPDGELRLLGEIGCWPEDSYPGDDTDGELGLIEIALDSKADALAEEEEEEEEEDNLIEINLSINNGD